MKHSEINWARLVELGKKLVGTPYNLGAETNLKDTEVAHIKAIDCSELVEWLYAQIGLSIPDGSYNQAKVCRELRFIPNDPKSDVLLLGDLGFKWDPETHAIHHVAIYIGGRDVLEAKGKKWGTIITPFEEYEKSPHFAYWARLRTVEDA